jgi:leucine dehydrogenase
MNIRELSVTGYERLTSCSDENGYYGLIAIHNTRLGPAIGGTRFWHYPNEQAAIDDVMRLARGMTYKNALAGIPFGGGKSIILKNELLTDRQAIFRAHGRFVETFGGRYVTAEDVGTTPGDMEFMRAETKHVAGLIAGSGDPSPVTARGVFRAMQAAAKARWGSDALKGHTVALQGCGNVGYHLASYVHRAGAGLIVTDVDATKIQRVVREFNALAVAVQDIYQTDADIFAPCALGGVLNDQTITRLALKTEIVVGAANNQLLELRNGDRLAALNILYVPDYAANVGGVINGCRELLGWNSAQAEAKVDEIFDTIQNIVHIAANEGIPTYKVADRLAEDRLSKAGSYPLKSFG